MSAGTETETDRAAKRARRKATLVNQGVNVEELEKRVHIAELRAREIEAELRYLLASQQRRDMKSGKRDKGGQNKAKNKNKNNKNNKSNRQNVDDEAD
jgi:hypothetical protein